MVCQAAWMDAGRPSPTDLVRTFFDAQGRSAWGEVEALLDPMVRWRFGEDELAGRVAVLDRIVLAADRHPEHLDRLVGCRLVDEVVEVDHELVLRDRGVRDPRAPALVSTFAVLGGRITAIRTEAARCTRRPRSARAASWIRRISGRTCELPTGGWSAS